MQINITTLLLALFGQTVLTAPVCHEQRSVAGRSILIGPESIAGRQLPPPDPERCAKLEETCDCSKIDKEKDMEKYVITLHEPFRLLTSPIIGISSARRTGSANGAKGCGRVLATRRRGNSRSHVGMTR